MANTLILDPASALNLFAEYWGWVSVESFTISIFAAILLQILLKLTLALEHRLAAYFKAKSGSMATFMRWFSAWVEVTVSILADRFMGWSQSSWY
jgi:hypothetical protein